MKLNTHQLHFNFGLITGKGEFIILTFKEEYMTDGKRLKMIIDHDDVIEISSNHFGKFEDVYFQKNCEAVLQNTQHLTLFHINKCSLIIIGYPIQKFRD